MNFNALSDSSFFYQGIQTTFFFYPSSLRLKSNHNFFFIIFEIFFPGFFSWIYEISSRVWFTNLVYDFGQSTSEEEKENNIKKRLKWNSNYDGISYQMSENY